MKDIAIKAVVTGPDGFYYREEHEWRGLSAGASAMFEDGQAKLARYISKASSNKEDDGLVALLDSTYDGKAQPQTRIEGISFGELAKFQRFWHDLEGDIINAGEKAAKRKDEDRRARRGRK